MGSKRPRHAFTKILTPSAPYAFAIQVTAVFQKTTNYYLFNYPVLLLDFVVLLEVSFQ